MYGYHLPHQNCFGANLLHVKVLLLALLISFNSSPWVFHSTLTISTILLLGGHNFRLDFSWKQTGREVRKIFRTPHPYPHKLKSWKVEEEKASSQCLLTKKERSVIFSTFVLGFVYVIWSFFKKIKEMRVGPYFFASFFHPINL